MSTVVLAANLQDSVDRYARSLIVPSRLLALHPRKAGGVGDAAALAPAIALGVISAFEGFVEDFLATALHAYGLNLGQIAKRVEVNNPDVSEFERIVKREFPDLISAIGVGFTVAIWSPPEAGTRLWNPVEIDWKQVKDDSRGWMQVRHCLSHGLTSGWKSERWPGPVKEHATTVPASAVLKPTSNGKHSLVLHDAITCARIYQSAGRHLADLVAAHMGETLSWSKLPEFPMYKKSYEEYLAENGHNACE